MAAGKTPLRFLILLLFLGAGVPSALAQGPLQSPGLTGAIRCGVLATPVDVRVEESAAALGDLILRCISGPAAANFPFTHLQTNFAIDLNVNVANNLISVPGGNSATTDAVMSFNALGFVGVGTFDLYNPKPVPTLPGEVTFTPGPLFPTATPQPPAPIFQDPQLGELASPRTLRWNGVRIPVPGLVAPPGTVPIPFIVPEVVIMRFTNLRANASQLAGAPQFPPRQIIANISVSGPTNLTLNNTQVVLGNVLPGLVVSVDEPMVGLQCNATTLVKYVKLTEGFPAAFRTMGAPTFTPGQTQWESGYPVFSENDPESIPLSGFNGGGVTQGTRFILRFFNVPDGVEIMVPRLVYYDETVSLDALPGNQAACLTGGSAGTTETLSLHLIAGADSNGFGGSEAGGAPPPGTVPPFGEGDLPQDCDDPAQTGGVALTVEGGFASAVYEVWTADAFSVEMAAVPVKFSWIPDLENELPARGTLQAAASFAPLSPLTGAAPNGNPVPRFVDSGGEPEGLLSIQRCVTVLLFPWVTSQEGFDTGFAIANTSEDWLGTDPQQGPCTLHFHGETAGGGFVDDQTSISIPAGDVLLFTLSGGNIDYGIDGAPEFAGYIMAVCEFQYAHGFAFLTESMNGVPILRQGYLALVVTTTNSLLGGRATGPNGMEGLSH